MGEKLHTNAFICMWVLFYNTQSITIVHLSQHLSYKNAHWNPIYIKTDMPDTIEFKSITDWAVFEG